MARILPWSAYDVNSVVRLRRHRPIICFAHMYADEQNSLLSLLLNTVQSMHFALMELTVNNRVDGPKFCCASCFYSISSVLKDYISPSNNDDHFYLTEIHCIESTTVHGINLMANHLFRMCFFAVSIRVGNILCDEGGHTIKEKSLQLSHWTNFKNIHKTVSFHDSSVWCCPACGGNAKKHTPRSLTC